AFDQAPILVAALGQQTAKYLVNVYTAWLRENGATLDELQAQELENVFLQEFVKLPPSVVTIPHHRVIAPTGNPYLNRVVSFLEYCQLRETYSDEAMLFADEPNATDELRIIPTRGDGSCGIYALAGTDRDQFDSIWLARVDEERREFCNFIRTTRPQETTAHL